MIHNLKTQSKYFNDVLHNEKSFEVRKNDRAYKVGDVLHLIEVSTNGELTGRDINCKVTYILEEATYCKTGYIVMAMVKLAFYRK